MLYFTSWILPQKKPVKLRSMHNMIIFANLLGILYVFGAPADGRYCNVCNVDPNWCVLVS